MINRGSKIWTKKEGVRDREMEWRWWKREYVWEKYRHREGVKYDRLSKREREKKSKREKGRVRVGVKSYE